MPKRAHTNMMKIKSQLQAYTPVYPIEWKGFVLIVIISNNKKYFFLLLLSESLPDNLQISLFSSFFVFHLLLHYMTIIVVFLVPISTQYYILYIFTNFTVHFGRRESIDVFLKLHKKFLHSNLKILLLKISLAFQIRVI